MFYLEIFVSDFINAINKLDGFLTFDLKKESFKS